MLVENTSARLIHVGGVMLAPGEAKEVNATEHDIKSVEGLKVGKEAKEVKKAEGK